MVGQCSYIVQTMFDDTQPHSQTHTPAVGNIVVLNLPTGTTSIKITKPLTYPGTLGKLVVKMIHTPIKWNPSTSGETQ